MHILISFTAYFTLFHQGRFVFVSKNLFLVLPHNKKGDTQEEIQANFYCNFYSTRQYLCLLHERIVDNTFSYQHLHHLLRGLSQGNHSYLDKITSPNSIHLNTTFFSLYLPCYKHPVNNVFLLKHSSF